LPKELVDFLTFALDGVTLAALCFIVASGFIPFLGLMWTARMAQWPGAPMESNGTRRLGTVTHRDSLLPRARGDA
jgi:hypothetical protein